MTTIEIPVELTEALKAAEIQAENVYNQRKSEVIALQEKINSYFLSKLPKNQFGYTIKSYDTSIEIGCLYKNDNSDHLRSNEIYLQTNSRWKPDHKVDYISLRTQSINFNSDNLVGFEYIDATVAVSNLLKSEQELSVIRNLFLAWDSLTSLYEVECNIKEAQKAIESYKKDQENFSVRSMLSNQKWVKFSYIFFEYESATRGYLRADQVRILKESDKTYQVSLMCGTFEEVLKMKKETFDYIFKATLKAENFNREMLDFFRQERFADIHNRKRTLKINNVFEEHGNLKVTYTSTILNADSKTEDDIETNTEIAYRFIDRYKSSYRNGDWTCM